MMEHAKSIHPRNIIVEGDLAALPFPDARVDGVLAWYCVIRALTPCPRTRVKALPVERVKRSSNCSY
jgi:hypothetical protein